MIAQIIGEVLSVRLDRAVISVGGLGLEVLATPATLATWQEGQKVRAYTHLVVREDSLTLFGFANADEQETFASLMSVKGIGPKLALGALAVMTPDALRAALASKDFAALQRIPGVGRKSAERMVIEIGDKLGPVRGAATGAPVASPVAVDSEVVEALCALGWSNKDAEKAVAAVGDSEADVSARLRAALQYLGGHRG